MVERPETPDQGAEPVEQRPPRRGAFLDAVGGTAEATAGSLTAALGATASLLSSLAGAAASAVNGLEQPAQGGRRERPRLADGNEADREEERR